MKKITMHCLLLIITLMLTSCTEQTILSDSPSSEHISETEYTTSEKENIEQPTEKQLEKVPRLKLTLIEDGETEQQLQAIQLTTSWYYTDENGNGSGYEADSPHPLQLSDYDDCTFQFYGANSEILLSFSDNYQPQFVSVQRWNTIYYKSNQNIEDSINQNEPIEVTKNTICISNDENDYIYEVYAKWEQQGSSRYAFRINSATSNEKEDYVFTEKDKEEILNALQFTIKKYKNGQIINDELEPRFGEFPPLCEYPEINSIDDFDIYAYTGEMHSCYVPLILKENATDKYEMKFYLNPMGPSIIDIENGDAKEGDVFWVISEVSIFEINT